jgi:hypothetical protein
MASSVRCSRSILFEFGDPPARALAASERLSACFEP